MLELVKAGGWPMIPLLLLAVLALAIVVERFWSLRRKEILPPGLGEEVRRWATSSHLEASHIESLRRTSPLGALLAAALDVRHRSRDVIRERIEDTGRHLVHRMERYLNTLGTIAAAGPLLGLLGTVVGMIEIFGSQSPTGNNPGLLAHGISIALYNTAFGLVVAIPSLMFYRYFRGRIEGYIVDMEQASERLLTHLVNRAMPTGTHAGGHGGPVTVPPPVAAPAQGKAKA